MPRKLYSTATHEDHLVDPDDSYILDNVVRFVGQRVAAVVAETEGAAEAGCRALAVDYELLSAVFDPIAAMAPEAPVLKIDSDRPRRAEKSAVLLFLLLVAANAVLTFAECGVGLCPDSPTSYELFRWR